MTTSLVRTRYGAAADLPLVAALHDRCTPEALHRRFHAPLRTVPSGVTLRLLEPARGWSLLAEQHGQVVGMACVGPLSADDLELGILVEDASQGRGIGGRLLREVARDAAARGYRSLVCVTQPDNHAVLATVARSGIPFATDDSDGLVDVVMRVDAAADPLPLPA